MITKHARAFARIGLPVVLIVAFATAAPLGLRYLRAAALLQRIADGRGDGLLADFDRHAVDESTTTIQGEQGPVAARLYTPRGVYDAPGMVIVHGVHHLGLNEPRLMAFARAIAASGIVVLTPEVSDIADYRITAASINTIGASARALHDQLGDRKVGVLGLSFSGGLSLLAAADDRYSSDIAFVLSIGGHDDLARVCEFFATDRIPHPDGSIETFTAHEYGALVLVYSRPEEFFSPQDLPAARDAIRAQLWEQPDQCKSAAARLSPAGRSRMELLITHKKDALSEQLMHSVRDHASEMSRVSPHGNLSGLHVPVLVLHGVGDAVIPTSEALWLEQDVPKPWLRAALITPVLSHVDVGKGSAAMAKFDLMRFIAAMLEETEANAG